MRQQLFVEIIKFMHDKNYSSNKMDLNGKIDSRLNIERSDRKLVRVTNLI